jgi:nucleoside 2-deoxyribosyltransferase
MNIYIACGLSHVPREDFREYVAFIHGLAKQLRKIGNASVRYALQDSDPQLAAKPTDERARLCYLWDREMVEWADVVVAETTYPSTGMGIELQIAENKGIPIILCFNESAKNKAAPVEYDNPDASHHTLQIGEGYVSLMALGLPTIFKVTRYSTFEDGFFRVCDAVRLLYKEP